VQPEVLIRKLDPEADRDLPLPQAMSGLAAGLDLCAALRAPLELAPLARALVPTGLAIALPAGWEGQIRPRSGLALRHGVTVLNAPGTIDADYRGELQVLLVNLGAAPVTIRRGDRVAQLVVAPCARPLLRQVEALPPSARAGAGFGSTGACAPPEAGAAGGGEGASAAAAWAAHPGPGWPHPMSSAAPAVGAQEERACEAND
jgi:dUTP pyrophosphatase